MKLITVDDLADPVFSEKAREILSERANLPIEFSIDGILEFARNTSDVPVVRDQELENNLESFLKEADKNGALSEAGKKLLAMEFAGFIIQRSRLENLISLNPEIRDIEIKEPIIIAGIPRSGTTNLSNIMANDSRLRALSFWESATPFPPKEGNGLDNLTKEQLVEFGQQALAGIYEVMPMAKFMYDISFDDAMEELCFMAISGCPCMHMTSTLTPNWNRWFYNEMDPLPMYQRMKQSLQAMNWLQGGEKRWVLKTPHQLGFLKTLTKVFPESHLIITHRDPASSTVSNATMNAYSLRNTNSKPNPKHGYQTAIDMADGMIGGLVRDFDELTASSITDIHFPDYMADVMGTLEKTYHKIGLPFTEQARGEMQAYIDAHPRGRHGGRLTYNSKRDFGVSREHIRSRYQAYIDKFSIRVEQDHA